MGKLSYQFHYIKNSLPNKLFTRLFSSFGVWFALQPLKPYLLNSIEDRKCARIVLCYSELLKHLMFKTKPTIEEKKSNVDQNPNTNVLNIS